MKGCKHRYEEMHENKCPNGYWFKCKYCGDKVFGFVCEQSPEPIFPNQKGNADVLPQLPKANSGS